jgi:hypothetical protein
MCFFESEATMEAENGILCAGDVMSRAIIRSGFASAAETAEVLGVSRFLAPKQTD